MRLRTRGGVWRGWMRSDELSSFVARCAMVMMLQEKSLYTREISTVQMYMFI